VIDLGYCLDLLESENLLILKSSFETLQLFTEQNGLLLPQNKVSKYYDDLLIRHLDCAVIENIHSIYRETKLTQYDSVRGVFWEGAELYPNAGFKEKNHIQICIRNPNCIKGFFIPIQKYVDFQLP